MATSVKSVKDLGYHFIKESCGKEEITVLKDIVYNRSFEYDVYGDESKNQQRYNELGEGVKEYVHNFLEQDLKFEIISIPVDAQEKEPKGFFFMSELALRFTKLMILVHGSGYVRAGQWSRSLIINDSLESGTVVPYVKRAVTEGFGIIITNGNQNRDNNGRLIKGSESPEKHFKYIWRNFISKAKAKDIVIVAHSDGGIVVLDCLRNIPEALDRITAVAFTHSTHCISAQDSNAVKLFMKEKARNWICSKEPLGTPIRMNCNDDCDQVSAGTPEHIRTSHSAKDSVFNFLELQLKDNNGTCKPTKLELISPLYRPHKLDSVYKMTSSPRGLAIIVNMNTFQSTISSQLPGQGLENREGSEIDVKGLKNLFSGLGFNTKLLVDLNKDELWREIQEISRYDFSRYDCFVLCIMSHGDEDYFCASDGGKVKIPETIEMFNNKNCQSLCEKPKLFFINACRGDSADEGVIVRESIKSSAKPRISKEPGCSGARPGQPRPTTAEHADIMTVYSSVEGYCSFRNPKKGSWFFGSLIEVFKEYAGVEDVESMLTRVKKNVNSLGSLGSKQVPKPESTLTKKLFFWPGMNFTNN